MKLHNLTTMIASAMRTADRLQMAELAVRFHEHGRGRIRHRRGETGYPPTRHLDAFHYVAQKTPHHHSCRRGVRTAVDSGRPCSSAVAARLGHGARIVDDIDPADGYGTESSVGSPPSFATVEFPSSCVRRRTSTPASAVPTIADHPIGMLRRRFQVTLNTDNRLMSDTSMTKEMVQLAEAFDWGLDSFEWLTVNTMEWAFRPFPNDSVDQRRDQPALFDAEVGRSSERPDHMAINTIVDHPGGSWRRWLVHDHEQRPECVVRQNLERIGAVSAKAIGTSRPPTAPSRHRSTTAPARRIGHQPRDVRPSSAPDSASSGRPGSCSRTPTSASSAWPAMKSSRGRTSTSCRSRWQGDSVIVVDPMLATGGVADRHDRVGLQSAAPPRPSPSVCALTTPEGIQALEDTGLSTNLLHHGDRLTSQRARIHRSGPRRRGRSPVRSRRPADDPMRSADMARIPLPHHVSGQLWLCGKRHIAADVDAVVERTGATTITCLRPGVRNSPVDARAMSTGWTARTSIAPIGEHELSGSRSTTWPPDLDVYRPFRRPRLPPGPENTSWCTAQPVDLAAHETAVALLMLLANRLRPWQQYSASRPMAGPEVGAQLDLIIALAETL